MKVFLTGGSGFIGSLFLRSLSSRSGWEATVLTRSEKLNPSSDSSGRVQWIRDDPLREGEWQDLMLNHDVIVNLAGASIFSRWSPRRKEKITESRLLTTRRITQTLDRSPGRIRVLLNASAVGYYGDRGDERITETSSAGKGFLADLTQNWEEEACRAAPSGVRTVLCRFGIVLSREGGALAKMLPAFRWGGGAGLGSGRQWVSWIHAADLTSILINLIERSDMQGPVNCTAPYPVTNADMTHELLAVLKKRSLLPAVPAFALRLILGEFAETLLGGQCVFPQKLLEKGFSFAYPALPQALSNLLA